MDTDASTRTNEMEGHARSANTCSALIQSSPQPSDVDMDQGEEVGTVGTVCSAESTKLRLPTAPFSPIAPTADLHSLDMELDFAPAPTCMAPVQPLPQSVPSGSNNTSTHEKVEKLVASGLVVSPSATDYTPWNRPSSPIAPVSIPLDVDDDDTVSIPDSPVVASPEIQLYPDTAGIHLGGGETSAHSHDVSETPSKFLKMVLLSVSETWPVIQHSLFKLFPPKCISGIIHIVQTVTISGQIIWMAAASIDAAVMLRGYLVDRQLLPGVRLGCDFISQAAYSSAASRATHEWLPAGIATEGLSDKFNQPPVSGLYNRNDSSRSSDEQHDLRRSDNQVSSNHRKSKIGGSSMYQDRSQSHRQRRAAPCPRRLSRSPCSGWDEHPGRKAYSLRPPVGQQRYNLGRSRSASPRRASRRDQPQSQVPRRAEHRHSSRNSRSRSASPRRASRMDQPQRRVEHCHPSRDRIELPSERPPFSSMPHAPHPLFSSTEQPHDYQERLLVQISGSVPFMPVPVLTLNPSLFRCTLPPLWAYPAANAAELMVPRYDPRYSPISPSTFHDVAHPLRSQTPAALPIFQRAGIRLHDRIEHGLENEPIVGFHEHLPDDRQVFRKQGKRGGVKHRQIIDGTSG